MNKINIVVIGNSGYAQKIEKAVKKMETVVFTGHTANVENGLEYIQGVDLVLLDVGLLAKNASATLNEIIEIKPVPIILLADGSVFQTTTTVYAMSNGAVDFVKMPKSDSKAEIEQFQQELLDKILHTNVNNVSSPVKVHTKVTETTSIVRHSSQRQTASKNCDSIVAVGSSTGGPRALQQLLKDLPKEFKSPIFIVQHMPSKFTKSLAERLNKMSAIRVKEAVDGEVIQNGTAYIAPGGYHMKIEQRHHELAILLTKEAARLGHRPSVNTLLESIATVTNKQKIIVILTGMGRDGSSGIKKVKKRDQDTIVIAESSETAVINGMPKSAIETNCVTEVLPIGQIGGALVDYTKRGGN